MKGLNLIVGLMFVIVISIEFTLHEIVVTLDRIVQILAARP